MKARVAVISSIEESMNEMNNLCLQKVIYQYYNGISESGFRFILRCKSSGHLKPQMGQANLNDLLVAKRMIDNAIAAWQVTP